MADLIVLGLFCALLLLCVLCGAPILYALAAGLFLFALDARRRGFSWGSVCKMALDGVSSVKNILLTFLFIGVLTALWRAAGTIPVIVCAASTLIRPSVFLLTVFLLNCGISALTGTSFGTAATVGVLCAAMAPATGADMRLVGGAVLSGAFFGDRCSPVSTSALLVAECTGTELYDNIRRMLRSALVPFLLAALVYAALGLRFAGGGEVPDLAALFGGAFSLHWAAVLPAVVVLLLAVCRVPVRKAMGASILTAVPLCLLLQGMDAASLLRTAVFGYHSADPAVAAMLDGGGVVSMARVGAIVCLSSSYAGIFRKTGLLEGLKKRVRALTARTTDFCGVLVTGVLVSLIACNQTLSTLLTAQLCEDEARPAAALALDLEDSVIVTAALVPWSIAGATPLASVGAPMSAMFFACYLYLLPLWRLLGSFWEKARQRAGE